MLIGFKFENYSSYKDEATLTLIASKIKEHKEANSFQVRNVDLLKSIVLYGKNASGKSNVFKAMAFMKKFILNTTKMDSTTQIEVNNFKLHEEGNGKPTCFEVSFIINNVIYKYGFKIFNNEVQEEWLEQNIKKFITLFYRNSPDGNSITIGNSFKEGKSVPKNQIRRNGLFLPIVAVFNGEISNDIIKWFKNLQIISGEQIHDTNTIKLGENTDYKDRILDFLRVADLGIENYNVEEEEVPVEIKKFFEKTIEGKDIASDIKTINVMMHHNKYNNDYEKIGIEKFDMHKMESEGTKKFFSLIGPIIESIENGNILIIDELDSKLHPLMVRFIVEMYNSIEKNQKNAQLIINTHNTTLLKNNLLRRDQVWFADKNKYGESELYSLNEYRENKNIRNDEAYEKNYLLGKYGAIPKFYEEYLLNRDLIMLEE